MSGYYSDKLSGNRLKQCYEFAPSRIQQYLEAEVNHIVQKIRPGDKVLELGCGYGRILPRLAQKAALVIGIDLSPGSLMLGREMLNNIPNTLLLNMDAVQLAFSDRVFDRVVCIQNGISAFRVNQKKLIHESIRVAKPGGTLLFSSYSHKFWKYRLEWFQLQSEAGLLGEINWEETHNGVIVCKDGFKATTVRPEEFLSLTAEFDVDTQVVEVDESSLFCEISPH